MQHYMKSIDLLQKTVIDVIWNSLSAGLRCRRTETRWKKNMTFGSVLLEGKATEA
jgi:hypothetical protein